MGYDKLPKLKDEKVILGLGFDSIIEYEKCMKCDYTNNNIPISQKKRKCVPQSVEEIMNCEPYILTLKLKDRIERERGIVSGIGYHERLNNDLV